VKVCRHVHLRRSRRRQSLQFVRAQSDTLARFEPRAGFPSRGLTPPSHSPTYHTFMRYSILPNNPSRVSSAAQKQWMRGRPHRVIRRGLMSIARPSGSNDVTSTVTFRRCVLAHGRYQLACDGHACLVPCERRVMSYMSDGRTGS
jgi:hypothetical protein